MARSFQLVEDKLLEADFFLDQLTATHSFVEGRHYFSAFSTAGRSVTFVLQACMADVPGFTRWYEQKRGALRSDPTSRFFQRVRNESQKIGANPICGGAFSSGRATHLIVDQDAPHSDAVAAARSYMKMIVAIIYDCFAQFGAFIDPDEYYTLVNLERIGWTLEDVEEELGFPRGWTDVAYATPSQRLNALRRHVPMSCVDAIFEKYLGQLRPAVSR